MIGVQIECGLKSYFLEEYETKVMFDDDPKCEICGADLTTSFYVVARERYCCESCSSRMTTIKGIDVEQEDFLVEAFLDDVEAKSYCLDEARILDAIHVFLTEANEDEPCAFRAQIKILYEILVIKDRVLTHHPTYKSLDKNFLPIVTEVSNSVMMRPTNELFEIIDVLSKEEKPWKREHEYPNDMYFVVNLKTHKIESVMEKGFKDLHGQMQTSKWSLQEFMQQTTDIYKQMGKELVRGMAKKGMVYFYHKPKSLKVDKIELDTGGEIYMYEV